MAAHLEIDELNDVRTTTHGVYNLNVGSVDAPNITVGPKTAIKASNPAFIKYNMLHFTDFGGATEVKNLRVWMSAGSLLADEHVYTNLTSIPGIYSSPAFLIPDQNQTWSGNEMPTSAPGSANLGIDGSLAGILDAPGTSDIWKWQVRVGANTPVGALPTKRFTFAWDET